MREQRKRFTIPPALLAEAEEYAKEDNRTFSEFVCEAIRQHMRRYPKKPKIDAEAENRIITRILEMIAPQVPAGTSGGDWFAGQKVGGSNL